MKIKQRLWHLAQNNCYLTSECPLYGLVKLTSSQVRVPGTSAASLIVILRWTGLHVTKICKAAYFHLHNIRRICSYLPQETTEQLVHAFVTTRLDQCNSLLYGVPDALLNRLQRVQNTAAHIVACSGKYCEITPLLRALHWLPVRFRIIYKILLLTYKSLNGLAPSYLTDLLEVYSPSRHLRSANTVLLAVPRTRLTSAGDRAFQKAAPVLWNNLPVSIRLSQTTENFKRQLKTHLFTKAFGAA